MTYALDTTGLSANNLVTGETHSVTPAILSNFGYVILSHGPFFGQNLNVIYTPAGGSPVTFVLGTDYTTTFSIPGIGNSIATQIWGALEFYNITLNGTITVTYQALGGSWVFNTTQIANYLNSNAFNASTEVIDLVPVPPLYLPNNPSVAWPINSVNSLVIAQAQTTNISLGIEYDAISGAGIISQIVSVVQDTPSKLKATIVGTGTLAVQQTSSIPAGTNVIGKVQLSSGLATLDAGTIANGGTSKQLFSGVAPTNGFEIINTSLTENLYFSESGTVSVGGATSAPIVPMSKYISPLGYKPTGAISIVAATTGHGYIGRSW